MSFGLRLTVIALLLVGGLIVLLSFERPPVLAYQNGYRGTGMEGVANPRTQATLVAANVLPEVVDPIDPSGTKSSEVYQNVQVLGDLDSNGFNRLMVAITNWVSPEEGCAYCHNVENMASDEVYTKVVARRMLQMTRHINESWTTHVGQTGVTCYTCHRGQPVPAAVWSVEPNHMNVRGFMADPQGQNLAAVSTGRASLPYDYNTPFLSGSENIRVGGTGSGPTPEGSASIMNTEYTYGLMMHMSISLGENCTYCHNSRAFSNWDQSLPARTNAWYGIRMVRSINNAYIDPLQPVFPANGTGPFGNRLGPMGDPLKTNCTTCHQGVYKPLLGAQMLRDYPELNVVTLGN